MRKNEGSPYQWGHYAPVSQGALHSPIGGFITLPVIDRVLTTRLVQ